MRYYLKLVKTLREEGESIEFSPLKPSLLPVKSYNPC
jgi:hypothetical protein